jgi:hypothetical protein
MILRSLQLLNCVTCVVNENNINILHTVCSRDEHFIVKTDMGG